MNYFALVSTLIFSADVVGAALREDARADLCLGDIVLHRVSHLAHTLIPREQLPTIRRCVISCLRWWRILLSRIVESVESWN